MYLLDGISTQVFVGACRGVMADRWLLLHNNQISFRRLTQFHPLPATPGMDFVIEPELNRIFLENTSFEVLDWSLPFLHGHFCVGKKQVFSVE